MSITMMYFSEGKESFYNWGLHHCTVLCDVLLHHNFANYTRYACALKEATPPLKKMKGMMVVMKSSFFISSCRFACSMAEGKDPRLGSINGGDGCGDVFEELLSLPEETPTKREVCTRCR